MNDKGNIGYNKNQLCECGYLRFKRVTRANLNGLSMPFFSFLEGAISSVTASNASFIGSRFTGTILKRVDFSYAKVKNSLFKGVKVYNSNMQNINLKGLIYLRLISTELC